MNKRKGIAGMFALACVVGGLGLGGADARHLLGMGLAGTGLLIVGWLQKELFPDVRGAVPREEMRKGNEP